MTEENSEEIDIIDIEPVKEPEPVEKSKDELVQEEHDSFTTEDLQKAGMIPFIVDEIINIDTGIKGFDRVQTNMINGYVKAILIDIKLATEKMFVEKFDLEITLSTLPEFAIFSEKQILVKTSRQSIRHLYIPFKVDHYNVNIQDYESPDFYVINERLNVAVSGPKNYKMQIRIRYSVN